MPLVAASGDFGELSKPICKNLYVLSDSNHPLWKL